MAKKNEPNLELYNDEQRFWADVKVRAEMGLGNLRNEYKLLVAQIEMAESKIEENK